MTVKTAAEAGEKPEFDKLLAELGDLHKAIPTDDDTSKDDAKIEAAAADPEDEEDDEDEEGEHVSKSFEITLADGSKAEAIDGTALLKSLNERVEKNEGEFAKALGQLLDIVKSQAAAIDKLMKAGKGRKAVLSVVEKQTEIAKAKPEQGDTPAEFFGKALKAQAEGKLNGIDVSRAETALNKGMAVPADILRKVYG